MKEIDTYDIRFYTRVKNAQAKQISLYIVCQYNI